MSGSLQDLRCGAPDLPRMPQYLLSHRMSDHAVGKTFRLLTMSTVIFSVTLVLLVLPLGVLLAAMYASHTDGFVWMEAHQ
jgi:hypothetical protein